MKTILMTAALVTLTATAASAKSVCAVMGEGEANSYSRQLYHGQHELGEQTKIFSGEGSDVYVSRKDGETTLTIIRGGKFSSLSLSDGKKTIVVDNNAKIAAACVDLP